MRKKGEKNLPEKSKSELEFKLRKFADEGDCPEIKTLLDSEDFKQHGNINAAGLASGQTALHRAAAKDHFEIVSLLLMHQADLTLQSSAGKTARNLAKRKSRSAQILLEAEHKNFPDNIYNVEQWSALANMSFSDFEKSMALLKINPNYEVAGIGSLLMFLLFQESYSAKISLLLEKYDANLNQKSSGDRFESTPLHSILINEKDDMVLHLLQFPCVHNGHRKLNPNLQDANGRTILMLAIALHFQLVVKFILEKAKHFHLALDSKDNNGYSALHYATLCRNAFAVKLLLEAGAVESQVDNLGRTPKRLLEEKSRCFLNLMKELNINVNRDLHSKSNALESIIGYPILKKADLDKLAKRLVGKKEMTPDDQLQILFHLNQENILEKYHIPAGMDDVKACIAHPESFYVFDGTSLKLLSQSKAEVAHLGKNLKLFSGETIQQKRLSAEQTKTIQGLLDQPKAESPALSAAAFFPSQNASSASASSLQSASSASAISSSSCLS